MKIVKVCAVIFLVVAVQKNLFASSDAELRKGFFKELLQQQKERQKQAKEYQARLKETIEQINEKEALDILSKYANFLLHLEFNEQAQLFNLAVSKGLRSVANHSFFTADVKHKGMLSSIRSNDEALCTTLLRPPYNFEIDPECIENASADIKEFVLKHASDIVKLHYVIFGEKRRNNRKEIIQEKCEIAKQVFASTNDKDILISSGLERYFLNFVSSNGKTDLVDFAREQGIRITLDKSQWALVIVESPVEAMGPPIKCNSTKNVAGKKFQKGLIFGYQSQIMASGVAAVVVVGAYGGYKWVQKNKSNDKKLLFHRSNVVKN